MRIHRQKEQGEGKDVLAQKGSVGVSGRSTNIAMDESRGKKPCAVVKITGPDGDIMGNKQRKLGFVQMENPTRVFKDAMMERKRDKTQRAEYHSVGERKDLRRITEGTVRSIQMISVPRHYQG